jgi:hypothetical protein
MKGKNWYKQQIADRRCVVATVRDGNGATRIFVVYDPATDTEYALPRFERILDVR